MTDATCRVIRWITNVRWSDGTPGLAIELEDIDFTTVDWYFVLRRISPCFEQATPYNPLGSLALWRRERVTVSAYILRKLLGGGKGVPNASRIAF